jgi:hypothetical protein
MRAMEVNSRDEWVSSILIPDASRSRKGRCKNNANCGTMIRGRRTLLCPKRWTITLLGLSY